GFTLQRRGQRECRRSHRDTRDRGLVRLLLRLDRIPVRHDLVGVRDGDVAEDVWMPAYQLVDEPRRDIVDRPAQVLVALLGEPRVKRNLEKHITEFLA